MRVKKDTVNNIILIFIFILGMFILYKWREPELNEYNAHVCAVYGKEADCKTPLPENRRLK